MVHVRDKGPGVSDDEKGRIFDKFAQSSDTKALEGTGLGLAICKQIIERHGGRIGVSDAQGGGSLFWVKIPKTPV
jgi:signal transduction histidine kinase